MNLYFTNESCDTLKSFSLFLTVKTISKLNMEHRFVISRCCFAEDAKKFTKIYNARAQLLFFSLNFLFSDVVVAVVVFLKSLLADVLSGNPSSERMTILGPRRIKKIPYFSLCLLPWEVCCHNITVFIYFIVFLGLDHQGIFRLSGSTTEINDMKQLFENGNCLES